jgi:hypothetical protein|tara:strand:+ start:143 stop:298 length:156 start_codon:yes stop_codon:yes gene_type:complete
MSLAEIKKKLEKAYNEEDWGIVEDLLETLSYEVEIEGEGFWGDDDDDVEND